MVFIQILAPVLSGTPHYRALAVHLRNGLYVNTVFDRTVGALYLHGKQSKPQAKESVEYIQRQESIEIEQYQEQPA